MKLRTKLSAVDCRSRLASTTDLQGMALSWDSEVPGAVLGEFRGTSFRLHTRRYYINSFAPFFYGKLADAQGGAIIEGRFRLHPFVRLFMVFWLSFLLLFVLGVLIVPSRQDLGLSRGWLIAIPVLLALFGLGLVKAGQWLGRGDKEEICSFLKNKLDASEF